MLLVHIHGRVLVDGGAWSFENGKHHGFLNGIRVSSVHQLQSQFETTVTLDPS